jgi:hypothetical protein
MEQVTLNASIPEPVGDLVGRAAVAIWHTESSSISRTVKLHTPQARIFPFARKLSNAVITLERGTAFCGQCRR